MKKVVLGSTGMEISPLIFGSLPMVMNVNYFYRSTTIIIPVLLPQ
jgi:hypothetical protein